MAKKKQIAEQEMDINEAETAAAATLKPDSMPADGKSKAGMMASMMSAMNGMAKSELVDFFNKSMSQFGANVDLGVPAGAAEKNAASIATKGAVKEDIGEMFTGEELSEDFREKVSTLIEAAINSQLNVALAEMIEEQEVQFDELVEDYKQELSEQVDEYLNYVVKEWAEQNKVGIENALKLEIQESFMTGLKNLFKEHYVDVPDEKYDVIGELESKVETLTQQISDMQNKNIELASTNEELNRNNILGDMARDLTESDAAKFFSLAEGLSYNDLNHYSKKLNVIKETYFNTTATANPVIEDTEIMGIASLNEEVESEEPQLHGPMAKYASAISRTIKR